MRSAYDELSGGVDVVQPMYLETAAYGHMGRKNEVVEKTFTSHYHPTRTVSVELFTWEKLDKTDMIKEAFGLK